MPTGTEIFAVLFSGLDVCLHHIKALNEIEQEAISQIPTLAFLRAV